MTEINRYFIFLTFSGYLLLSGCLDMPCNTNYIRKTCSPDQNVIAVCYFVDCGATTGGPFSIGLLDDCDSVSDTSNPTYLFTHENPVAFKWLKNDTLEISFSGQPLTTDFKNSIVLEKSNKTVHLLYDQKNDQTKNDSLEVVQKIKLDSAEFECIRGKPEPSIDSAVFPTRQFKILNNTTAIETVSLENGDNIIIRHSGCEYFIQTYRFETARFQADTSDILFWYKKAVRLLNEIEKADQSPIDIKGGLNAMVNYIDIYTKKHLGEEIDFSDSEIRNFVTLDRIEQLNKNRFGIEVTYAIGPL